MSSSEKSGTVNSTPTKLERILLFPILPKVINAGVAGILGLYAVYPLDITKTKFQNQQVGPGGERVYKSMLHCFKSTYANGGYFAMYKGSSASKILLTAPEIGFKLVGNDFYRCYSTSPGKPLPFLREIMIGVYTGMIQYTITTPIEPVLIKCQRIWREVLQKIPSGKIDAKLYATTLIFKTLQSEGTQAYYKGTRASLLTAVLFSVIYFPIFTRLNWLGPRKSDGSGEAVFWCSFLSGCTAGSVAALCVNPIDVVNRACLQTAKEVSEKITYDGIMDTCRKIFRRDGAKAFFKGGACSMIVVGPLFGITQVFYYQGIGEFVLGYKPAPQQLKSIS